MKIITYILAALLVAALGAGAYVYFIKYQPMDMEYMKLKAGQPEFDKARKELKRFQERDKQESAWIEPVVAAARKTLENELGAGTAEIVVAGRRVVINIAEGVLYTPMSVTFARNSQQNLAALAAFLKDLKDKEIVVGNMTQPAPAQGKGRKKIPAKDARTLAAGRSLELVKYLEKNGVPAEALVTASYAGKLPDRGFRIKDQKTVIVIAAPAAAGQEAASPKLDTKPAPATRTTATAAAGAPGPQPKSIPISTVPPKKVQ